MCRARYTKLLSVKLDESVWNMAKESTKHSQVCVGCFFYALVCKVNVESDRNTEDAACVCMRNPIYKSWLVLHFLLKLKPSMHLNTLH